jgi:DNA invertase Pin-like site-specific DNA recombinase
VSAPFVIYTRASIERDGKLSSDPADQETAARLYASQHDLDVHYDEDECNEVASGGLAAKDRKLGLLIQRCEAGEFAGIIVRDENRFARDVIAGGSALKQLVDCGARLIATATGFDSGHLTPASQMVFNIMMSVGQAARETNVGNMKGGKLKAARRGEWVSLPPLGYDRDPVTKRLTPNADAAKVKRIFELRAKEVSFSAIAREVFGDTAARSSAYRVVTHRAYLGIQTVPDPDHKGKTVEVPNSCKPLVTEPQWEAANAVKGQAPARTGIGETTHLKGIVRCGVCGHVLHVLGYGKSSPLLGRFVCTKGRCAVGMPVHKLEPAILHQLDLAIATKMPQVAAVIEGDDRYEAALAAVETAKAALAEYRDNVEMQQILGVADFTAGLKVRKEAVETARVALREVPPPKPKSGKKLTLAEFNIAQQRDFNQRVIDEILVFPRANKVRVTLRWTGTTNHIPVDITTPPVDGIPVAA